MSDFLDVGDLPEIPEDVSERRVPDQFDYATAFSFAFLGVGQGGGRIAESFYHLGYRSVAALNTTHADLASIGIPDSNKLDLGGAGAGKDPSIAAQTIAGRDEDVYDLLKGSWDDQLDFAMLCFGAGGGTGAGCWPKCAEVVKRYLDECKRPPRLGAVVALPENGEGNKPAANTLAVMKELAKAELSPLIIVDNERMHALLPKTAAAEYWKRCNGQITSLFHLFNRIAAAEGVDSNFDAEDLRQLLDSGVVSFGATVVRGDITDVSISSTIRKQLRANVLAPNDISKGQLAGCIYVCGQEIYDSVPKQTLNHGYESLNRILAPNSTVFRGLYIGNTNDLRCYTMIGGMELPKERLQELATKAGDENDLKWMK